MDEVFALCVNHLLSMFDEVGLTQWMCGGRNMGNSLKSANFLMESRLADAARGSADALYDLGMAYSTGSGGVDVDLIEAHKWFNLAALNGSEAAMMCRADISDDMTAREIAEAQRQARAWLQATDQRRAA
jgi:TPR repeat protein